MKNGVISLGEALIDFIPMDASNTTYQKSPGGAPANVAVGAARLGVPVHFLGKVGNDVLGTFLKETLTDYGVHTDAMTLTDEARTGAVFVTLADNGERSFDFYIQPSADTFLSEQELSDELFQTNKILHFGSISLIREPAKSATIAAVKKAKESGMMISYDPNLRLNLWDSEKQAREAIISMLPEADVLKISEEELTFLTGETDVEAGVKKLASYHIPLIFITLGGEGSYAFVGKETIRIPAMKVQAVDTTGAGDAFVSGILYHLNEYKKELSHLTIHEAAEMGRFASVSGGLAASVKGAMTALPTLQQVKKKLS